MKILVISGFLGAGKTTFLKEMIKKSGKKAVILENEYGETDLDAQDINASSDDRSLKIMEFMEGCVCCSKKDTFANSLVAISASLDPEYLVVEPSGVGRLSNILSNVNNVVWDKIRLLKPVVILAPSSFFNLMQEYPEIYEDQIKNAGIIVYSKIENADQDFLAMVTEKIRNLNPDAEILSTPYQQEDSAFFNRLFDGDEVKETTETEPTSSVELDQITLKYVEMPHVYKLACLLEAAVKGLLGGVVRAKGILQCAGAWIRFDMADNLYQIGGCPVDEPKTQCVFIGCNMDRERIESFFDKTKDAPEKQFFWSTDLRDPALKGLTAASGTDTAARDGVVSSVITADSKKVYRGWQNGRKNN